MPGLLNRHLTFLCQHGDKGAYEFIIIVSSSLVINLRGRVSKVEENYQFSSYSRSSQEKMFASVNFYVADWQYISELSLLYLIQNKLGKLYPVAHQCPQMKNDSKSPFSPVFSRCIISNR